MARPTGTPQSSFFRSWPFGVPSPAVLRRYQNFAEFVVRWLVVWRGTSIRSLCELR